MNASFEFEFQLMFVTSVWKSPVDERKEIDSMIGGSRHPDGRGRRISQVKGPVR
jgi:hypothetical protein